jgi:uncharacterized membrane protein YkgB
MTALPPAVDRFDERLATFLRRHGVRLLRWAVGIVFVWFGALKLFPGVSPAEALVKATVPFVDPDAFYPVLAVWEILIGLLLIIRPGARLAILLLALQMPGTFLPFVVLPEACWARFPFTNPLDVFVLTLEGQYIVKNLVLVAAAVVVGGTVRREPTPEQYL